MSYIKRFKTITKAILAFTLVAFLIVYSSADQVSAVTTTEAVQVDDAVAPASWWTGAGAAAAGGAGAGLVTGAALGGGSLSWSLPGTLAGAGAGAVTGAGVGAVAGFVGYAATTGFNALFGSESQSFIDSIPETAFDY